MTHNMIFCQQLAGKFSLSFSLFCILSHSMLSYYTSYFTGLSCCHDLSLSLSAALLVSIIHHLHSQAIYTSFYSQSVFPLCWLHLSTLIQLFQLLYAVLGCLQVLGLKKSITTGTQERCEHIMHIKPFCYHKRRK